MIYYNDEILLIRDMKESDATVFYHTYLSYGWHPNLETYKRYFADQQSKKRKVFVAEYEKQVAGICTLVLNPIEGPFAEKGIPQIVDFGVFFHLHRHGIGNKLLDIVEGEAAKISDEVYLAVGVHSGYGAAQRIYVKRGYMPDGSGVWYQNKQLEQYAPCCNDDELLLFLSKKLSRVKRYLFERGQVKVRVMEDVKGDYELMAKWLQTPEVLEYYEGKDKPYNEEKVMEKYGPRVRGEEDVTACMIEYKEKVIGYIQYYTIEIEEYGIAELVQEVPDEQLMALDLFIGEVEYWEKGIGTEVVSGMIHYLEGKAHRIFIDPQTWNTRAVRCYEKSGFRKIGIIPKRELHNGEWKDSCILCTP